jgi:hypothetical protein
LEKEQEVITERRKLLAK